MTEPRKPSLILLVAGTVLLLGGYVGAYYLTVRPAIHINPPSSRGSHDILTFTIVPKYRLAAFGPFFAPAHWLDGRIRPHVWEPK